MDTIANNNLGWMSRAERAQVRAHSGLEWVFHEPRGLNSLRRAIPTAPEETTMLASVYQRAASGAAVNIPRDSVNWRTWAVWAAAGVLAVLALMLLPRLLDLRPQSAWAMVDGYILEYDLEFDEEYTQSAAAAPDHPLNALIIEVNDWDKLHRAELGGESTPRAGVDILRIDPQSPMPNRASLKVLLPGATADLRDDLIATLAAIDGLSEPKVYSQRWYYREKYPELFVEHHRLVINGKNFRFPEDFSDDEIDSLLMYLNHCARGGGKMYVAYLEVGKRNRFGLGDVVGFETNSDGDIEVFTYAPKLEFAPGEKASNVSSWWIIIPSEEENLDFDPIELLKRQVSPAWTGQQPSYLKSALRLGNIAIVDLLPTQRWMGVPAVRYATEIKPYEQRQAAALFDRVQDLVAQWGSQLPTNSQGQRPEWKVEPMEGSGVTLQAWIEVWTTADYDCRSYIDDLERQLNELAGVQSDLFYTHKIEGASAIQSKTFPPEIREYYSFYYNLLPGETTDLFDDEIAALWSDEEKLRARETAERIEVAFSKWLDMHADLREEREIDDLTALFYERNNLDFNQQYAYIKGHEQAGVLRSVTAYLYRNNSQLAAELQQALSLDGVLKPSVHRPGDPRNSPEMQDYFDNRSGYRIDWDMFSDFRMGEWIAAGRKADYFTAEEQANARKVLGSIRDRWREWLKAHPQVAALEYKGLSVHHLQINKSADVPTSLWIQLGIEDEELLADLLTNLEVAGAPEPNVTNLREEWEKEVQQDSRKDRKGPRRDTIDLENIDGYRLIYHLFPKVDTMYLTYDEVKKRFSKEELDQAYDLARQLCAAFEDWKAAEVILSDEAQFHVQFMTSHTPQPTLDPQFLFKPERQDQVVIAVWVELQRDDAEWFEECKAALSKIPIEPSAESGRSRLVKVIRKDG